jgi:predicted negative regulator of RcsB-dependent stress response
MTINLLSIFIAVLLIYFVLIAAKTLLPLVAIAVVVYFGWRVYETVKKDFKKKK